MRRLTSIGLISVALCGPAFAQKAEIQKANAKWVDLFNKGDFAAVGMLYTKDAVALPSDAPMVKGRDAITAMWKDLAGKVSDPALNTIEVKRLGPNAAREIGTFRLKTKGPNSQSVAGKYVVIWQKENGSWKLSTDIWNSGQ